MEFEHEKNIVDYQNNPNSDDSFNPDIFCLICLEQNGVVVLCKRCKYKYCQDCAEKINNACSICIRMKKKSNEFFGEFFNENPNENHNENFDIEYNNSPRYFCTICFSIITNIIVGFSCIVASISFGYVLTVFLYKVLYQIIKIIQIYYSL